MKPLQARTRFLSIENCVIRNLTGTAQNQFIGYGIFLATNPAAPCGSPASPLRSLSFATKSAKSRHHHLAEVESTGVRINDAMPTSVRQITLTTATIMIIWRNSSTVTAGAFTEARHEKHSQGGDFSRCSISGPCRSLSGRPTD